MTPLKRWLANLTLFSGGILAACLITEIALRLVGISFPIFYSPDSERGWALPAGASGWFRDEGESYVRINSDGLIDREHTKAKPPNAFRIAVLGDSMVEAMQLPRGNNFCSVMEQELNRCGAFKGKTVEVINFGVGGYSTAQELLTLRDHAWAYSPDIVVLAICWGNDIEENSRALDDFPYRPYFVYRGISLVLDASFHDKVNYHIHSFVWRLIPGSRVVQVVKRAKDLYIQDRVRNRFIRRYPTLRVLGDLVRPEEFNVYSPPKNHEWEEAWRVTEGLIRTMHDEVTEKGAEFLVVIENEDLQVYPDPVLREKARSAIGSPDLFYASDRLETFCQRSGIQYVNLAQPFQKYADLHHVFLQGFANIPPGTGHWNSAGHRLAGQLIAKKICSDRELGVQRPNSQGNESNGRFKTTSARRGTGSALK
jgi:hypothetical protein